jgi:hypothetical protein
MSTTLTDCLALFIACLFVVACLLAPFVGLALAVFVIVWAAVMALKAAGLISLLALAI